MRAYLEHKKYFLLLISLVNLILTPIYFYAIGGNSPRLIIAVNMMLILLAGFNVCKKFKGFYLVIGIAVCSINILTVFYVNELSLLFMRLVFTGVFYLLIFRLTFGYLIKTKTIEIDGIYGAITGYFLIGLFGGVVFEFIYYTIPDSFNFSTKILSDFHFYYYSFTGVTTVGFGDIVPTNPQSQSISILMNIAGQLYLAIIMALFVGKYINKKNK